MKEIEDYTKKWKDILCSWIGGLNIVKMSVPLPFSSRDLLSAGQIAADCHMKRPFSVQGLPLVEQTAYYTSESHKIQTTHQ